MAHSSTGQKGFTLVELMICITIIAVLFALSTINFGSSVSATSVNAATDTLLADIKSQQSFAMAGEMGSKTSQQPHGIFVEPNQYTLYAGANFSSADSNNFSYIAPTNITFSSTFPSGRVLFNTGDGGVRGFVDGSNTITVHGADGTKIITVNRFGATTVQ